MPEPSWFPVGLVSSFPEAGSDDENLLYQRDCKSEAKPGCRVFDVPKENISQRKEIHVAEDETEMGEDGVVLKNQVLIFKHRGKMHAVDHVSHSITPFSHLQTAVLTLLRNAHIPRSRCREGRHSTLRTSGWCLARVLPVRSTDGLLTSSQARATGGTTNYQCGMLSFAT